jgi:hypothetical protein
MRRSQVGANIKEPGMPTNLSPNDMKAVVRRHFEEFVNNTPDRKP